jgi:hypothetical protein
MVAQTFLSVSGRGVEGIPALPSRPEEFLRVRSGGRNAPARGLATDKNVCPTSEADKNVCPTSEADKNVCPTSQTDKNVCPTSQADKNVCPAAG